MEESINTCLNAVLENWSDVLVNNASKLPSCYLSLKNWALIADTVKLLLMVDSCTRITYAAHVATRHVVWGCQCHVVLTCHMTCLTCDQVLPRHVSVRRHFCGNIVTCQDISRHVVTFGNMSRQMWPRVTDIACRATWVVFRHISDIYVSRQHVGDNMHHTILRVQI